jgi:general secretion pathway protein D
MSSTSPLLQDKYQQVQPAHRRSYEEDSHNGLVVASAALMLLPSIALADSANVSVVTPGTVSQGATFSVDVNISGATDLYAFQLDLSFDPSVLSATGVSEGSFLPSGGSTFFLPGTIDNVGGTITSNADTLLGAIPGVSGSGTLIVFDFTALAPGTSIFTIGNEILLDSTGAVLSDTTTNGSVTVQGPGAVPEPSSLMLLGVGVLGLAGLALKKTAA